MATKKDGFFGTDNLHRAGWAALIGLAGFLGALLYQKAFGPQKVVVEAMPPASEPSQVTAEVSPRGKEIAELAAAIRQLSKTAAEGADQKRLRELTAEVDRLRTEVSQVRRSTTSPQLAGTGAAKASATGTLSVQESPVHFELPETAGGYTSAKLFGVTGTTCPDSMQGQSAAL